MSSRKDIRAWIDTAMQNRKGDLGQIYSSRYVVFDSENPPDKFINYYIESGIEVDDGVAALIEIDLDIVFNSRLGTDDDLDVMEQIANFAIENYRQINRPDFDYYKTGFSYEGGSEDTYNRLTVNYKLITR